MKWYTYSIYTLLFSPPCFSKDTFVSKPRSALQKKKRSQEKTQVDQLVQDRWEWCLEANFPARISSVRFTIFFSRKKNMWKEGCNATWGFQDIFSWNILALLIVTLQKVQRISCRAILCTPQNSTRVTRMGSLRLPKKKVIVAISGPCWFWTYPSSWVNFFLTWSESNKYTPLEMSAFHFIMFFF